MVIIIEGLDCVGKTTLSKELSKLYNYEYIKESYTNDYKVKEQRLSDIIFRIYSSKVYVYDRATLIDDFVYDSLNKETKNLNEYLDIIKFILSRCLIVHLTLEKDIIRKRLEERKDEYVTFNMLNRINKNYHLFYKKMNLQPHYIKLTTNLYEDIKTISLLL